MVNGTKAPEIHKLDREGQGAICNQSGLANGKEIVCPLSHEGSISAYSFESYKLEPSNSPLAYIDGWPINVANQSSAIDAIIGAARRAEAFSVFTLNLDHLVKLRANASFRRAYRHARFTTADGAPVAMMAARQDASIERTTGADLVVPLLARAANEGLPVYLFGTSPRTIVRATSDLVERSDGVLDIAGSFSPAYDFDPEGPEADAALDKIAASGARLCLVALGAPKQELFAARAVQRGINVGFICIGAALDFLSGEQIRAPDFMRRNGLEWLWRLSTNPRRLAKRYALCALLLADLAVVSPIRNLLMGERLAD